MQFAMQKSIVEKDAFLPQHSHKALLNHFKDACRPVVRF